MQRPASVTFSNLLLSSSSAYFPTMANPKKGKKVQTLKQPAITQIRPANRVSAHQSVQQGAGYRKLINRFYEPLVLLHTLGSV
jgi:hypothetical protein